MDATIKRKTIAGKEYSCAKLPYRKARPLQLKLVGAFAPMLASAMSKKQDGDSDEALGKLVIQSLPSLVESLSFDLIVELCETCTVNGARVNVDLFNADEPEDIQVAILAVETHFVNFIKGLQKEAGNLLPKTATKP